MPNCAFCGFYGSKRFTNNKMVSEWGKMTNRVYTTDEHH